jgi:hypothetical protein
MPRRIPLVVLAIAVTAALLMPAASGAKSKKVRAHLRVVTPTKTLDRGTDYRTGTVKIKTDPNATCLGAGGSGNTLTFPGPTALGIVRTALNSNRRLRPLSISDGSGFGIAVCGIGGVVAPNDFSHTWDVWVNNELAAVGADQIVLHRGDSVVWAFDQNNYPDPPPGLLTLKAPRRAQPGQAFEVKVRRHACSFDSSAPFAEHCTHGPAVGASVGGETTDANGLAMVTLQRTRRLVARLTGDIRSEAALVCVKANPSRCPSHPRG